MSESNATFVTRERPRTERNPSHAAGGGVARAAAPGAGPVRDSGSLTSLGALSAPATIPPYTYYLTYGQLHCCSTKGKLLQYHFDASNARRRAARLASRSASLCTPCSSRRARTAAERLSKQAWKLDASSSPICLAASAARLSRSHSLTRSASGSVASLTGIESTPPCLSFASMISSLRSARCSAADAAARVVQCRCQSSSASHHL